MALADIAEYAIRVLTEDGEVESYETYPDKYSAEEDFDVILTFTFDTESEFYPGDPYWTLQLIRLSDGTVEAETNSIKESKGLAAG